MIKKPSKEFLIEGIKSLLQVIKNGTLRKDGILRIIIAEKEYYLPGRKADYIAKLHNILNILTCNKRNGGKIIGGNKSLLEFLIYLNALDQDGSLNLSNLLGNAYKEFHPETGIHGLQTLGLCGQRRGGQQKSVKRRPKQKHQKLTQP